MYIYAYINVYIYINYQFEPVWIYTQVQEKMLDNLAETWNTLDFPHHQMNPFRYSRKRGSEKASMKSTWKQTSRGRRCTAERRGIPRLLDLDLQGWSLCWWFNQKSGINSPVEGTVVFVSHYLQSFSIIPGGCLGFLNHQQYVVPGLLCQVFLFGGPPFSKRQKKKHPIFKKFLALCFQMFEKRLKVEVNFSGSTLPETNSFSHLKNGWDWKTIRSHLDCLVSGANCSF